MNNDLAWEREYQNPQFLTLGTEPLADVRDFIKWLRRKQKVDTTEFTVLDLGCGNGKNLNYIIDLFAKQGIGYDISSTAINHAQELAGTLPVTYEVRSISDPFPLENKSIDLVLDVTASNSLSEAERAKFLKEISRVLKPGSYCFTRALCKDGDDNAKNLIKDFPGLEYDTYVLAETGITERVFSKQDFIDTYNSYFEIIELEKKSGYQRWGNQKYKRNYWLAYLKIKKN
ncbi:MAG: class I SAM-dependent methyltransferase [bacterium]